MVSRPTRGTTFRATASSAMRRSVQRAAPAGGGPHTIAMTRCLSEAVSTSAAPGRGASNTARATPPAWYRRAMRRIAGGVRSSARATSGARAPRSKCSNASTRRTTRVCCTPRCNIPRNFGRSRGRNRNGS